MIGNDIYVLNEGINILPFVIGCNNDNKSFKVNVKRVWIDKNDTTMIEVILDENGNTCEFYYNGNHGAFKYYSGSDDLAEKILSYEKEDKMFEDENIEDPEKEWNNYLEEITDIIF